MFRITAIALLAALISACAPREDKQLYELVITGGRVIDPETRLDATRNVGILNGRIAAVSERQLHGTRMINATGRVVAPGFIDLHSHAVLTLAGARMQVMDGVTTALELEEGAMPVGGTYDRLAGEGRPLNYGMSVSWRWSRAFTTAGTEPELLTETVATRLLSSSRWQGLLPPHISAKVLALVEQGLREGSLGVGANLGYMPESNAEEFYAVAQLAKKYNNAPTFVHIRYNAPYGDKTNLSSHEEVIAIAAMTGAHMHFCHLNSNANRNIPAMIAAIEQARKYGIPVTWEANPYGPLSTQASAPFIAPEFLPNMGMKPSDLLYLRTGERIKSIQRLEQIRREDPAGGVVAFQLDERQPVDAALLDAAVTHPDSAIASDATYWQEGSQVLMGDEWPQPADATSHPRAAGAFSKVVGRYVRAGKLTLNEAIRKATLLPAQILEESVPQMRHKGRLRVGADADIVIFDASIIEDRATVQKPNQTSVGIDYVIVNGVPVVEKGQLVKEARPGRPIRNRVKG